MKAFRFACVAALLLGSFATVSPAKPKDAAANKTYFIYGEGSVSRAPELLTAAAKEVDTAMRAHGFSYTANPEQAGTIITVRFIRRSYEIDYHPYIPHSRYPWADEVVPRAFPYDFPHDVYTGDNFERARDLCPAPDCSRVGKQ